MRVGRGHGLLGQPYENAYDAWRSVFARALGAERQTVCESGKGLVRNCSAEDHFRTHQLDAHDQVVAHYEGAADVTVQAITASKIYPPHRCSGHPDAAEHEKMTLDDILPPFQAAMDW